MTPVSIILHDLGIRILWYLDDWLILALSRMEALWARDIVLNLCQQLGIVVILAKSHLNPSRTATYLGMSIEGEGFGPLVTACRIFVLQAAKRRCLAEPSASSLLSLSSGAGGRLRMRSLQLELRHHWDFTDESVVVPWTPEIERDLMLWFDTDDLLQGVSLEVQRPNLLFWSDASDHR